MYMRSGQYKVPDDKSTTRNGRGVYKVPVIKYPCTYCAYVYSSTAAHVHERPSGRERVEESREGCVLMEEARVHPLSGALVHLCIM